MKKKITFILYNIIVTFAFFSLIEIGIVFLLDNSKYIPRTLLSVMKEYYMDYDRNIIQFRDESAVYDSTLFYKLREGNFRFTNREFDTKFSVNKLGVRDDVASLNKPKVIILGDSHTMGWGVNQDETFANLLERKLHYKVLNSGISSYGTAREMRLLNEIDTDSLQFLIIQYFWNDYRENANFYLNNNTLNISSQDIFLNHCKNHRKESSYYLFKHLIKISSIIGKKLKSKDNNKEDNKNQSNKLIVNEFSAFLNALTHHIKNVPNNTKIIILSIEGDGAYEGMFIKGVKAKLEEEKYSNYKERITLLDLSSDIDENAFFILDEHMNPCGHQIIANKLEELIKQE